MADIQTGRFGPLVQALFNLKQRLTLGQVFPDVMPVLDLEHPRAEMEIFSGNDLYWGFHAVSAVAGQNGQVVFSMPASAGRIAIVEKIIAVDNVGPGLFLLNTSVGGTAGATAAGVIRDTRRSTVASSARVTLATSAIPSTTNYQLLAGLTGTPAVCDTKIVIAPRGSDTANLLVQHQTANRVLNVGLVWRERNLGQQETSAFVG